MADWLAAREVELIVLAGYMELLSAEFVRRFPNRIVNVHPALLPSFPGLDAVGQALEHGVSVTGVTVHFVDEGVDSGPIILQRPVNVPAPRPPRLREGDPRGRACTASGGDPTDRRRCGPRRRSKSAHRPRRSNPRRRMADPATPAAGAEDAARPEDTVTVRRALISVSDKTGIVDFARGLERLGVEIVSTGGTAAALARRASRSRDVADLTGSPEILAAASRRFIRGSTRRCWPSATTPSTWRRSRPRGSSRSTSCA